MSLLKGFVKAAENDVKKGFVTVAKAATKSAPKAAAPATKAAASSGQLSWSSQFPGFFSYTNSNQIPNLTAQQITDQVTAKANQLAAAGDYYGAAHAYMSGTTLPPIGDNEPLWAQYHHSIGDMYQKAGNTWRAEEEHNLAIPTDANGHKIPDPPGDPEGYSPSWF